MTTCPSCGHENREGAKFCEECASPLGAPARVVPEERKVITSLFCDLVGFTASSEAADPEDVDRVLSDYAAMARRHIESYGGVVEKFIGDAVVGIFGVPVAHEDDPERAVRTGLRIVEDAERLEAVGGAPLRLRVGINTGEALVRLGVRPSSGERLVAGDAINTAARLQSVAPEMGVAVGLATHDATAAVFDYVELEPAELKGKADRVRMFHAVTPRARFGTDITRTHDTPFIGREIDLALLKGIFDKAVASSAPQLVTVVGEPGIGKSRIVAELFAYIDARTALTTWRQGRCLPYGEGITFWALGEIVKAHAGILESDSLGVAQAKLDAVLPDGPERAWFRQRLLPLLGIEATSSAEREELFTAWRRFLEHIAEDRPTVLVFEDLHWADDAMLAFLEHLADRAERVPLLVVGTARPDLYERHPGFASGLHNANRINLSPLAPEETARLVSGLLETTVIPAGLQQPILDRSEGNPLYAEEFVRLLRDRELLVRTGSSWALREGAEVPFPDSVHALIAARLDTLGVEAKSMLADAAVVGKVFWTGAVAEMGGRDIEKVTNTLRELSRSGLIRPARRSSIEGEAEHSFAHILTRDVAYAQLPRAARAARHVAAARWIEAKIPHRVEDLADVLAHHYSTALELARASGHAEQAADLETPALRFLTMAGERALGLDTVAAMGNFGRALALARPGHPRRPETLVLFGEAALAGGHFRQASEALEDAVALFRGRGDLAGATRAMTPLWSVLRSLGDPRWTKVPAEALALLEQLPPGPELVNVLGDVCRVEALVGRPEAGVRHVERALALAEELGLDRSARILGSRGLARITLGDPGGLDDTREAIAIAVEAGQGREASLLHNNLGVDLLAFDGPAAALEILRAGIAFARARGLSESGNWTTASTLHPLTDLGRFDEALEAAARLAEYHEATEASVELWGVRAAQARILTIRGRAADATDWLEGLESSSPGSTDFVVICLGASALVRAGLGNGPTAALLLDEIERSAGVRQSPYYAQFLPALVRTALEIGDRELAERLAGGVEDRPPYFQHAVVAATAAMAEASRDLYAAAMTYADAAGRLERFGVVPEQGFALLGEGRCLIELHQGTEAVLSLRRARSIFDELGAAPAIAETDALLQQAAALSS